MWYVRLKIRDDRLAKLWAWKLAEHDVIVWSEAEERWKQLLAVPELRAAVRKATTSAYVRKSIPPALPAPGVEPPDSRTRRRHLQSVADFEGDELTTRVNRDSYPDMEPTAVHHAPRPINYASSVPPPPPVDMLRALSTSIPPPAVHSTPPPPQFPPAPRVPSLTELARSSSLAPRQSGTHESSSASFLRPTQSDYPEARSLYGVVTQSGYSPAAPAPAASYPPVPSSYPPPPPSALQKRGPTQIQVMTPPAVRPQYVVAKPASQFTIKNLSWAMLPVACAGVFAIFLDRYAPPAPVQGTQIIEIDSSEPGGPVRSTLGSILGMSIGPAHPAQGGAAQPQDPAPATQAAVTSQNLTPEQLAPVNSPSKASSAAQRSAVVPAGKGAAKFAAKTDEKEKAAVGNAPASNAPAAAPAAQGAINESFDREGARAALKFAAARVRNCSNSGVTGSALITFLPAGTVQKVQISKMVGDDVDESCVHRALAGTRVPPFAGAPVTVRKSF